MNYQQATEAQLLKLSIGGDVKAYGEIYDRHAGVLYHYLFYSVAEHQIAAPLIKSYFQKLWQMLDKIDLSQSSLQLWLYHFAYEHVLKYYQMEEDGSDQMRRGNSHGDVPERSVPHPEPEIFMTLWAESNALQHALEKLNLDHQQVLICRFIVGLSHADAGFVLSRSEEAVRALQYRAINALRQRYFIDEHSYE